MLPDSPSRDRLTRLATTASVSVAAILAVAKLAAAFLTGSVAILSLLIDSLADLVASGVTFVAVRIAQQPPDQMHRFGHGKAEALAALVQAALVAGTASFVLIEALRRMLRPVPVEGDAIGIAVIIFSLVATVGLVLLQRYVVARTGSPAIAADRLHFTSDLLTNAAVLVSLLITARYKLPIIDPLMGAFVALVLLRGTIGIGRRAINELMDRELPTSHRAEIERIVMAHPEVAGIHDLRSRQAAGTRFIEFHIELDGAMNVRDAHKVTDALEHELAAAFPDSEVIIHQEPAGLTDERLDHRIEGLEVHQGASQGGR
jgi:ferrous-iron efflux pump FieF